MIFWDEELEKYFNSIGDKLKIEDLSDFDRTQAKTLYVAINGFEGDFGSLEFDEFSEHDHVFYMVINISQDETKAYIDFLKYVKGSKGQNLIVSETPFLKDHEKFLKAGRNFILKYSLNLLEYKDLVNGEKAERDFFYSPKEVQHVKDLEIEYMIFTKKDEKDKALLEEVRKLFRDYEKHIGLDLDFQDFQNELENLPGAYAGPKGAIILAKTETDFLGCIALRPIVRVGEEPSGRPACEMKRLYVKAKYGGLGIGGELIRRLINHSKTLDYDYMRLDTLPSMNSAIKLYESFGFYDIPAYVFNPVPGAKFMELKL